MDFPIAAQSNIKHSVTRSAQKVDHGTVGRIYLDQPFYIIQKLFCRNTYSKEEGGDQAYFITIYFMSKSDKVGRVSGK